MLRIAVPNKGRLSEEVVLLLKEAGYNCQVASNQLTIRDHRNDIDFFFLRPKDIVAYVYNGILDLGITGRDLAFESELDFHEILPLELGKSWFRFAVPADSPLQIKDFQGLRIATSYPNLVTNYLNGLGIQAKLIKLDGAVEISVQLGIADAIADVVQSGKTIEAAGLQIIGEPVVTSEAIVISKNTEITGSEPVQTFIERLKGIITARKYVMIEYDINQALLEQACRLTPGIESPTVSPLNKQGWFAIKSMVNSGEINQTMDELKRLGAKGIIVTKISSCRL